MTASTPGPDNEVHDLPLADRIACAAVRDWLDRATAVAHAGRGELGCEPAEHKAIEEMRYLHLADYSYTVVPRILNQLRLAGLLKTEVSE